MLRQLRASGQALCNNGLARELAALAFLAAAVLLQFRDAIRFGLIAYEKDTVVFFYPLERWFASEFHQGRFPLWNPYIFAGYPGFADGEIGMAYPLHLALLSFLSVDHAFIWLRVSSVLVAAWGAFGLCRALRLGRPPAVVGALVFGFGSFFVSQQHHENVTRTAAWLPLILACTEWALQRAGWRRHVFLTAAGVALAMAALGLHPQVLGMTLLGFATYTTYRVLFVPVGPRPMQPRRESSAGHALSQDEVASIVPTDPLGAPRSVARVARAVLGRGALLVWAGCYVGVLGLGLASIQLLPLAELGLATYRGSAPEYFFATSYALPIQNLVSLVLPYFFRGPEADYWSLWARWETALYVGVAPLVLGVLGAILGRRRIVGYFVLLALGAIWLAFASYAPLDLYSLLWQIPGFSAFRVPGRYTYLFVLAGSVLAAYGVHALGSDLVWDRMWARRVALLVLGLIGFGFLAGVAVAFNLRSSLLADPTESLMWLQQTYLSLRQQPGGVSVTDVYEGLIHSLDWRNPRTLFGLLSVQVTLVLAAAPLAMRRKSAVWGLAFVGITTVDLVAFGASFHQKMPVEQLVESTAAIRFLGERLENDRWRVFTPGESVPTMEHNRLVPFRLPDVGGYSSAEPRDNFAYWTTVYSLQNRLLDLANVRYLVSARAEPSLPSYRNVPFDPERPLLLGGRGAVAGAESYTFGGVSGHRLQVIAGLARALTIPQNDVVAELRIVATSGATVTRVLRAGVHVAEWAYDRPDVIGKAQHQRPAEVAFRRPDVFALDGSRYDLLFGYSELDISSEIAVDRVEIRYVHEQGGMELYGLGLYNFDTRQTVGATQSMRSGRQIVYQDADVRIIENATAFPRAYVVPNVRVAPVGKPPLSAMLDTPFDPTTEVMLNAPLGPQLRAGVVPAASGWTPALVERINEQGDRVEIQVRAPDGGYLVHVATYFRGWRAWVDGQEAPVVQANSLFRAVPLPAGTQRVELRYEPLSFSLGSAMTVWAASGGLAVVGGALLAALVSGGVLGRGLRRLRVWTRPVEE